MENNKQTILTDPVIASEARQSRHKTVTLDRFVPRDDAKRCLFGSLLLLGLLFSAVSCRFNHHVEEEKTEVDNLMRYAHNVVVSEKDYGYLMEVICPWDTTLSLGKFAMVKDTTKAVDADVKGVLRVPVKSVISFSATQWAVFLR